MIFFPCDYIICCEFEGYNELCLYRSKIARYGFWELSLIFFTCTLIKLNTCEYSFRVYYSIFCAFQSDRSTTPAASIDSAMESWDSECHDTQLGAPGNGHSVQPMVVSRPLSRVNKSGRSKYCLSTLGILEKL